MGRTIRHVLPGTRRTPEFLYWAVIVTPSKQIRFHVGGGGGGGSTGLHLSPDSPFPPATHQVPRTGGRRLRYLPSHAAPTNVPAAFVLRGRRRRGAPAPTRDRRRPFLAKSHGKTRAGFPGPRPARYPFLAVSFFRDVSFTFTKNFEIYIINIMKYSTYRFASYRL